MVMLRDVNHSEAVANMRHELDGIEISYPRECGVDKCGVRHCEGVGCVNQVDDAENKKYCSVSEYARINNKMHKWIWMPQMLDYFWRSGVSPEGFEFFEGSGFVWSYKYGKPECLACSCI